MSNPRQAGYIAAVLVNLILIYVVNNLLNWGVSWITSAFVAVLWAMNLSLAAQIVANLLWYFYDPRWLRSLVQIVLNGFGLLSTYMLYVVFPFDFGQAMWGQWLRIAFIVGMVGIGIGTVAEIIRLCTSPWSREE
jgi:hypothetical protein